MSKHTPGPWEWDGDYLQEVDGREGGVLEPFATNSCDGVIDCTDADRALIAAAPELYAALEMVAKMTVAWEPLTPGDIREVTAALAKARGEV